MPIGSPRPKVAVLLVAAGKGLRAGGAVPKQYRIVGGKTVLHRAIAIFAHHPAVDLVIAAIGPDNHSEFAASAAGLPKVLPPIVGGATRQASGLAGLEALVPLAPDIVLIHDAARPFASDGLVERAIRAAVEHGAAAPGMAVTDTIKIVDDRERAIATPPRATLRAMQTPQAFHFTLILDAHRRAAAAKIEGLTDDAAVAEWAGHSLHVFQGEAGNMKLTNPEDFETGERLLSPLAALGDVRTGQGFDIHAFEPGDHIWLNGVRIPHSHKLNGHSDADVGLHALTDAVLGSIGAGDIGQHFPPSDPKWKGASSDQFLAYAASLVEARGGKIANLDVTILAESPKIGPHREAMRAAIARIVGIPADRVGVQATTLEKLGSIGRSEGIAALAIATVRLPWVTR